MSSFTCPRHLTLSTSSPFSFYSIMFITSFFLDIFFAFSTSNTCLIFIQVKKFPSKFKNKQSLKDVLSKLLWLTSGYHAAVTFPQLEYAGFLPNAPYRLFADDENNNVFSNLMFGNKVKALVSPVNFHNIIREDEISTWPTHRQIIRRTIFRPYGSSVSSVNWVTLTFITTLLYY